MLNSFSGFLNGNLPVSYPLQKVSFPNSSTGYVGSARFAPTTGVTYLVQQLQALQQVQAVPPTSYDIYVSSINGNDNNNGLSAATAKRTIAGAAGLLTDGKSLGLEYGSHFREMLLITQKNVRVGAYTNPVSQNNPPATEGQLPILDASDVVTSIEATSGATNTYQFTINTTGFDSNGRTYPFSTFQDGKRLKRVNSLATCTSTEGSFWPDIANARVYFHPIGNVDPRNPAVVIEVAVRDAGIDVTPTATELHLSRIYAKRSQINDGVMRLNGKGAVATDCVAEDGTKHTLYVTDGCLLENVVAWKGEGIDSYFIYYYANGGNVTPTDSVGTTFRRCAAIGDYPYGSEVTIDNELQNPAYNASSGFYCHSAGLPSPQLASATYEGCYAENLGSGFGGEAQLITTRNCYTYLVATCAGGAAYAGQVVNIQSNTFDQRDGKDYQKAKNEQRTPLSITANGNEGGKYTGGTTNIDHNVILMSQDKYGYFLYAEGANVTINLNNNTFYSKSPQSNGIAKHGTGLLTFTHNVFYNPETIVYYETGVQVISSDNVYYRQGNRLQWVNQGASAPYSSLSEWQAIELPTSDPDYKSYQDARSVLAAPLFTPAT